MPFCKTGHSSHVVVLLVSCKIHSIIFLFLFVLLSRYERSTRVAGFHEKVKSLYKHTHFATVALTLLTTYPHMQAGQAEQKNKSNHVLHHPDHHTHNLFFLISQINNAKFLTSLITALKSYTCPNSHPIK